MSKKLLELVIDFQIRNNGRFIANEWLNGAEGKIYVRKSHRLGKVFLDLANIFIYEKGKGFLTQLIKEINLVNLWDGIYVENALEPRFRNHLLKIGFHPDGELSAYLLKGVK